MGGGVSDVDRRASAPASGGDGEGALHQSVPERAGSLCPRLTIPSLTWSCKELGVGGFLGSPRDAKKS